MCHSPTLFPDSFCSAPRVRLRLLVGHCPQHHHLGRLRQRHERHLGEGLKPAGSHPPRSAAGRGEESVLDSPGNGRLGLGVGMLFLGLESVRSGKLRCGLPLGGGIRSVQFNRYNNAVAPCVPRCARVHFPAIEYVSRPGGPFWFVFEVTQKGKDLAFLRLVLPPHLSVTVWGAWDFGESRPPRPRRKALDSPYGTARNTI